VLALEGVRAKVGSFELSDVDLELGEGRYMVLMGPTGAGKTTLLNVVAGLLKPLSGRVLLNGRDITDLPPEKRPIGYVFQDNKLFPHLTAWENVAFGPKARRLRGRELKEAVRWALELVGAEHLADRRPHQLSGGEAKKIALARALALRPKLLLLDEPLAHIDERSREELLARLGELKEELGLTAIHVTHDRLEALKLADDLAFIDAGRLLQAGEVSEVLRKPSSELVARFLGYENVLRCRCRRAGDLYELNVGDLTFVAAEGREGDVLMCLRAEDIFLSREAPRTSARNVLKGHVVALEPAGPLIKVRADVGSGVELVSVITPASRAELSMEVGADIYLAFKASSVRVI